MTFDELNIGDMFNTKEARYVKISKTNAIVVMSAIYNVGTEMFFHGVTNDVIVLYTTISQPQHIKPILGQEGIAVGRSLRIRDTDDDDVGFTQEVLNKLRPEIDNVNDEDIKSIVQFINVAQKSNWSIHDTVRYCMCSEEISPDLDEDVALARMQAISDKYILNVSERK